LIAQHPAQRQPPHDLEAETSILGALLLEPRSIEAALEVVAPEDFYRENNGQIYRAAQNLYRDGEPIDTVTLAAELAKLGVLERVGGRGQLALLQETVPTTANVEHWARIVADRAQKRRIITLATRGAALGYDESKSATEVLNLLQAELYAMAAQRDSDGLVPLGDLLKPVIDGIDAVMQGGGGATGVPSGFRDLDRMTNGFQPGDLVILAGRPSMGKTSAMLQAAVSAALEQRVPVGIFSLEMSRAQIVMRILCTQARVDAQRLARGTLSDVEYDRLANATGPLGDAPIFIDDSPMLDEMTMRMRARRAVSKWGIGLVALDYLQLMAGPQRTSSPNRVQEVSALSRGLKAIARELSIPVIAVSQLSRAPESRPDKRPILSDLRESGGIEQDADVVMFLYRDDYYNREKSEKPGIAEVIVAKHRNGPTGVVEMLFRKELTRFENIDRRRPGPIGDEG
jgi:replicative DNA helicase